MKKERKKEYKALFLTPELHQEIKLKALKEEMTMIEYVRFMDKAEQRLIKKLSFVRVDDSCECENCYLTRAFIKNPHKEVHRKGQKLQALKVTKK